MIFVAPFTGMHELRDEGAVYSEIYYDPSMDIIRRHMKMEFSKSALKMLFSNFT